MDRLALWQRYRRHLCVREELGLTLDPSRLRFPDGFVSGMEERMAAAYEAMAELEAGGLANPDEGRQVGHYWLRAPELAPDPALGEAIVQARLAVDRFAAAVHAGEVRAPGGQQFTDFLLIGIGGSALGPQLLADALGDPLRDRLVPHFFDNTDPDGMARELARLGERLATTLVLVVSKSGGTPETRNGMVVVQAACAERGLDFAGRAVAVTGEGSELDRQAVADGWLARFPMWSWVGGRTSVTSAVGLLPAALQGLDVAGLLAGAAACDVATRERVAARNPAALLALSWFFATGGRGEKDMVVLPYKDRLLLFSRYLQQLVMESLGKGTDLAGQPVAQGIAVYGNKGSTDQHAYVQQLREGVPNFFVTFLAVLAEGGARLEVEPGVTAGDYLRGFMLGTREALYDNGRDSVTITIDRLDAYRLGVLIALYERAVGFYASLVGVNAYHQPGVEAGKKAAAAVLELERLVVAELRRSEAARGADELALAIGRPEELETVHHLLVALAANRRGVEQLPGADPFGACWRAGVPLP